MVGFIVLIKLLLSSMLAGGYLIFGLIFFLNGAVYYSFGNIGKY